MEWPAFNPAPAPVTGRPLTPKNRLSEDRSMATQISKLAELVLDGQIVSAVEDKGDYFTDFG